MPTEFKVGDSVECRFVSRGDSIGRHQGVIEEITSIGLIQLDTQDSCEWYLPEQCTLIERSEKKVVKTMYQGIYLNSDKCAWVGEDIYETERQCREKNEHCIGVALIQVELSE